MQHSIWWKSLLHEARLEFAKSNVPGELCDNREAVLVSGLFAWNSQLLGSQSPVDLCLLGHVVNKNHNQRFYCHHAVPHLHQLLELRSCRQLGQREDLRHHDQQLPRSRGLFDRHNARHRKCMRRNRAIQLSELLRCLFSVCLLLQEVWNSRNFIFKRKLADTSSNHGSGIWYD